MKIDLLKLSSSFKVQHREKPLSKSLDPKLEVKIENIWEKEKKILRDKLTNGFILSVVDICPEGIITETSEFKYHVAQMRDPSLFQFLKVRPLAVSGLLKFKNKYLLGRRSKEVVQEVAEWEVVPSGGVHSDCVNKTGEVDIFKQVLIELEEETGIPSQLAEPSLPTLCFEDSKTHVVDLGVVVEIKDLPKLLIKSNEHDELKWIEFSDLPLFAEKEKLCDVTKVFLESHGLLDES